MNLVGACLVWNGLNRRGCSRWQVNLKALHALTLSQKSFSVAKIEHAEVMDEHGKQKVGGLMDPKMGSMSFTLLLPCRSSTQQQPSTATLNAKPVSRACRNVPVISGTLNSPVQSFMPVS